MSLNFPRAFHFHNSTQLLTSSNMLVIHICQLMTDIKYVNNVKLSENGGFCVGNCFNLKTIILYSQKPNSKHHIIL